MRHDLSSPLLRGAIGLLAVSCVPVTRLPLTTPAEGSTDVVQARASSVSASGAFLSQRGDGRSVLAVTVTATSTGADASALELDRASLVLTDPAGTLGEITLPAWTSGPGEAPEAIGMRDGAGPFAVRPGESRTFWIAFRSTEPMPERDLPRRVVLRVPVVGGRQLEVVLAEPSTGRPRWVHPPIRHASYAGLSVLGTPFEEGSIGILRASSKNHVGRVILGPSLYLGARAGELRGERASTISCCDFGVSFDVSVSALRGRDGSFGPYFTYQSVFALESGRPDKATWHGPGVGLQFFTRLIEPLVASGLPVRPTPSPLGYSSFTIAYVHLFRRGDAGGSPAMLLLFEHTLPEW